MAKRLRIPGAYRLRMMLRARRKRRLHVQAGEAVRRFPTVKQRQRHGLCAPLVVTLTSYPPRFDHLGKTLRSLLDQTVDADRTELWLARHDVACLPADVRELERHGLTIRACDDLKSYKKLIPALESDPGCYYVTADDDVYYPPNWLAGLVTSARHHPADVIAGRVHEVAVNPQGRFAPYSEWKLASDATVPPGPDVRLFPTGVGGVLYPPGAFAPQVTDRDLFTRLAPRGDDIWFFWMSRLAGTSQRRSAIWFDIVEWPDSQDVALYADNLHGDGNDRQLDAMFGHFGRVP